MSKKLFLIIGAPGSGKTTDAQIIAQSMSMSAHYSTGDLLRAEVARDTERGRIIASYIDAGKIVPIEIAIETIVTTMRASDAEVILFDGYPRSVEQMEALQSYLATQETITLIKVIEVRVSDATAQERVVGRARGADDALEIFNHRMALYHEPLDAIRTFYGSKLCVISGEPSVDEVVEAMKREIYH